MGFTSDLVAAGAWLVVGSIALTIAWLLADYIIPAKWWDKLAKMVGWDDAIK